MHRLVIACVFLAGCGGGSRPPGTVTCTPGESVTVACASACGLGSCSGEARLYVCNGTIAPEECSALVGLANFLGEAGPGSSVCAGGCPGLTVTCPASGSLSVNHDSFNDEHTCNWTTGDPVRPDGGMFYPPSVLPIDCRPIDSTTSDGQNPSAPECAGPIGSGDTLEWAGPGLYGGYYDAASNTFIVNGSYAIMTITRSGVSTVLSGPYEDLATGTQLVGAGPEWPAGTIVGVRPWTDGNIVVMAGDGFYFVDRNTGARSFFRDYAGVPPENQIREQAGFAVDGAGAIYVALARLTSDGGCGVFRFTATGQSLVTLSGAGDTTRNVGTGPDDGISEYADIEWFQDAIWLLNLDRDGLLTVNPTSGDRRYISRPGLGEDIDGAGHYVAGESAGGIELFFGAAENAAFTFAQNYANPVGHYRTKIDLATGNRSYPSEFFAFEMQSSWFSFYLDTVLGRPIHYDEPAGILYTVTLGSLRAVDMAAGNYNLIRQE